MKILAFESSAKAAGAALLEDGILRAEAMDIDAVMPSSCASCSCVRFCSLALARDVAADGCLVHSECLLR